MFLSSFFCYSLSAVVVVLVFLDTKSFITSDYIFFQYLIMILGYLSFNKFMF